MSETSFKPIIVKGKHNEALVFAKALEASCENKIRQYLDHPDFAGTTVRIMPDVHIGKGTVIGWTATYKKLIIPSVIGLDIGCGVCACNLGRGKLAFDKLDKFIRKNIPAGLDVRDSLHKYFDEINAFVAGCSGVNNIFNASTLINKIQKLCVKSGKNPDRVYSSLGTLGGGNHFIEIDVDENRNL